MVTGRPWAKLGGLAIGLSLATCTSHGGTLPGSDGGAIRLMGRPWVGAQLDNAIATILMTEQMGLAVEEVPEPSADIVTPLGRGTTDVDLEVWPDSAVGAALAAGTVDNGGALGPVGKIGWFVPTYLLTRFPHLTSWQGLTESLAVQSLVTPQTSPAGRFVAGDPAWGTVDEQIVKNLGLALKVVYLGSEAAEMDELDKAYAMRQPLLLYLWYPHWAFTKYELTEVKLPAYSDACYAKFAAGGIDCDYPTTTLTKLFWPGFAASAPRANAFLRAMSYPTKDQIALLGRVQVMGETPEVAARYWIDHNPDVWRSWIPP